MAAILSTLIPLCYGIFFTSANEPVHELFQEWLEIDVHLDIRSSPIVLLFTWAALAGGGAVFIFLNLGILYMLFAITCISSLIPTQVSKPIKKSSSKILQYSIETTSLGTMTEGEAILAYRTQQLFSVFMNEIFASMFISLHLVVLMVILVGVSFVLIVISNDAMAAGFSVVGFVVSGIFAVVLLLSAECILIGRVSDLSKLVLNTSKNLTTRRSVYRKFIASCRIVYLDAASPFFVIDKGTFAAFMCQYLDFLIQLLLCQ
ncbi:unnamed protein product [Orchesella dallaii]|uniref:Uncharacterized protein n=1 Tax=Orchesella dallaii TaxID=48710 RepID=A0ABP1QQR5_9HEXA